MVLPRAIKQKLDAENFSIMQFVFFAADHLSGRILLDAGAGQGQYMTHFSNVEYVSVDLGLVKTHSYSHLSILADLQHLPFRQGAVDNVLCTQVLEHVPEPRAVLDEIFRVMRHDGRLFLTAPQGWGIHDAPYDFFRFTKYGLRYLLANVGFVVLFIRERGGYFWYIGHRLSKLPYRLHSRLLRIPATLIFTFIVPFLCFYLDRRDHEKDLTLGYACYCLKP